MTDTLTVKDVIINLLGETMIRPVFIELADGKRMEISGVGWRHYGIALVPAKELRVVE